MVCDVILHCTVYYTYVYLSLSFYRITFYLLFLLIGREAPAIHTYVLLPPGPGPGPWYDR